MELSVGGEPMSAMDWEAYRAGFRAGVKDVQSAFDELERRGFIMKNDNYGQRLTAFSNLCT